MRPGSADRAPSRIRSPVLVTPSIPYSAGTPRPQAFVTYDPDDATTATVLDSIAVGDGLRIDLTEPARWWPQGTAPPPVVFVGDVDADTAIALATAYERGRRLFIERFDAPEAAEITGYIYADAESLGSAYRERYGRDLPEGWCVFRVGAELHQSASCHSPPDSRMGERYFNAIVVEVAPSGELPTAEDGYLPWGPQWLVLGMQKYSSAAYISAFGSSTYESLRAQHVARARAVTLPLSSMETDDGRDAAGWWETASLGFLASESLARRASEEALVEYLRLLSSSTSWQEAFEGAFEISVADFHEAFEAQRTASIPFLPHLADDVDEPILVFIGDIAPEVQEELRTSLEASQYLFEAQCRQQGAGLHGLLWLRSRNRDARVHQRPRTCEDRALRGPRRQGHLPGHHLQEQKARSRSRVLSRPAGRSRS